MKDMVEIAAGDNRFKTLVAIPKSANLAETLHGKGSFIVSRQDNKGENECI